MLPILQPFPTDAKGVKNILFDLGGVLFHIDYQRTIDAFKKLGITDFERHFTQHQQNDLFDAFEIGKIKPEVFVKTLQKVPSIMFRSRNYRCMERYAYRFT